MHLNVLIADSLSDAAVDALREIGAVVRVEPGLAGDELAAAVGDAEVLIVRSTKVGRPVIEAARSLSLIIRAGAGVNTIDIDAASEYGISVANCPGKNTAAVAELTIGLIVAADRRIPAATADLQAGRWRKKEYGSAAGLNGRRIAVIGLGSIGRAVARAAAGLGMHVQAWSRSLTRDIAEDAGIEYRATLADLVRDADVVTVHLAASHDTAGLIDSALFDAMKPGAIFVNTSRGEIVDERALRAAIDSKGLKAGVDVYADEPSGGTADYRDTDFALQVAAATPHIGASTDEASEAIADEVVRIVRSYVETGKPVNAVNLRAKATEQVSLVVRHYNRVGVLATVLDILRDAGINIEEMENTIFRGGTTASCALKLDRGPDADALAKIRAGENVIQVMLKESG